MKESLSGYVRSGGFIGFRNHVLLIPTVTCAAVVCERIVDAVEGCVTIPHQHGCSQIGDDAAKTFAVLLGMGCNPNVGAVLVVSLGCEVVDGIRLTEEIAKTGKRVEFLRIQDEGGSQKAIHKGIRIAQSLCETAATMSRQPVGWDAIRLAVKWGDGIDEFPGDPGVLRAMVRTLLSQRSVVMIGETEKVQRRLDLNGSSTVPSASVPRAQSWIDIQEPHDVPHRMVDSTRNPNPFPDVFEGGRPVMKAYADIVPQQSGVHWVETPCSDVECLSAFAASGANICVYFSGGPSPIGSPIVPVIKIGRPDASEIWRDHLDGFLSASSNQQGDESYEKLLLDTVAITACGDFTAAEWLGHQEFSIHRVGLSL